MVDDERIEEWERLYCALQSALANVGTNDAFGEGEYWIVDDDYGGHHHKICITKEDFWTETIQMNIQKILQRSFPKWGVYIVFEERIKNRRAGFIIYPDGLSRTPRDL